MAGDGSTAVLCDGVPGYPVLSTVLITYCTTRDTDKDEQDTDYEAVY